jgi:hypothetical protein
MTSPDDDSAEYAAVRGMLSAFDREHDDLAAMRRSCK